jgi:hypothetical protein
MNFTNIVSLQANSLECEEEWVEEFWSKYGSNIYIFSKGENVSDILKVVRFTLTTANIKEPLYTCLILLIIQMFMKASGTPF